MQLLNKTKVESLYSAMCALNNVYANFEFYVPLTDGTFVVVKDHPVTYEVTVKLADDSVVEVYDNQAAFAAAYGVED